MIYLCNLQFSKHSQGKLDCKCSTTKCVADLPVDVEDRQSCRRLHGTELSLWLDTDSFLHGLNLTTQSPPEPSACSI